MIDLHALEKKLLLVYSLHLVFTDLRALSESYNDPILALESLFKNRLRK